MNIKVGIAQTPNSTSLDKNFPSIKTFLGRFEQTGVDLILFPECSLSGFFSKVKECDRETLNRYLTQIQTWTDKSGIDVVLPSAVVENGHAFNSGFWFKREKTLQFYKTGLTDSEKKFFSVPDGPVTKVFELNGVRFAILICFEAEHGPRDYFNPGDVDVILWPAYWGWTKESTWGAENRPDEPNLVYRNQMHWRCPILQANFAFNDLEGHSGSADHIGLAVSRSRCLEI